jgi:sulfur carrier protein ThiS
MVLTMAAVAAHKGITPAQIAVAIERQTVEGAAWQTDFVVDIDLGPGLGRRDRIILFNSARRCEVHKLISGEIAFEYRLSGAPPAR